MTKRLTKKHIYIIITSLILALLITAYVIINSLFNSGVIGGGEADSPGSITYDESIGESHYLGTPTIYPYIKKDSITRITVSSHKDDFIMQRPQLKDSDEYLSYFIFRYKDEDSGKFIDYMPNITFSGEKINYENFYSIETADGLNATKVEYLCAMIGALYFQNRVELKADTRDEQLKLYGLDSENREIISVNYLDADGKEQTNKIYIGDKLITGTGYYFMLDGREYVYASAQSDRLGYALGGFEKLVASRIIAPAYGADGTFEPYLTTGYKQWSNRYYDAEGTAVSKNGLVTFLSSTRTPDYEGEGEAADGYIPSGYKSESMLNLKDIRSSYRYDYIRRALCDMQVSATEREAVRATVLSDFLEAELYDAAYDKGNYSYSIKAIEAIYTADGGEISTLGTPALGAKRVKVTYDVSLDRVALNTKPYHAVIDLDSAKAIPDSAKAQLLAAAVGSLDTPIEYGARYVYDAEHPENTTVSTRTVSFQILSINQIYKKNGEGDDATLDYQEKIDSKSIVYMSVCYVLEDEYGNKETTPTDSFVIDLSQISEGDDLIIRNAILGMGAGKVDEDNPKIVELGRKYYQDMQSFVEYDITRVVGFMEQDLTVAFHFPNGDTDDFYGEGAYNNILGKIEPGHKYASYAINVENCDRVVRILGGISAGSSSQSALGLTGSETVAVGLTPEVMRYYELYKGKTVSFGLPRGVDESPTNPDTYIWDHELTFTLYISPVQYDKDSGRKFYYVGSDMYDTVVKLMSDELDYLDYSFPEFWARRNMVMISSDKINKIEFDFNMSDLYGSYVFDVEHQMTYIDKNNQKQPCTHDEDEEHDCFNDTNVRASINGYEEGKSAVLGKYTETALSKYLVSLEETTLDLGILYNKVAGDKWLSVGYDTAGTYHYRELLMIMFSTYYMGVLESDEITAGEAKDSLMKMSFTVKSSSTIFKYSYEFRRLDDRRIMVTTFRENEDGERASVVSDFYITDFAFKKIVSAYTSLLSGKAFDADTAYGY